MNQREVYKPMTPSEQAKLRGALEANYNLDRAVLMDSRDTSFAGTADGVTDDEVINAIKSVPTHY